MALRVIHLIGFGSQASAWGQCLRDSGWSVRVYLPQLSRPNAQLARDLGFPVFEVATLPEHLCSKASPDPEPIACALLCPDSAISEVYEKHLALLSDRPLRLILAHGFSVAAGLLRPQSKGHELLLFAPKAIGPKLRAAYTQSAPSPHSLKAATNVPASSESRAFLQALGSALGFAPESLISTTFEIETQGDLLSEQGLLCGGVFSLLSMTANAMREAGVPPALIREECLTELELIANMLREKGPATTLDSISEAARAGAALFHQALENGHVSSLVQNQLRKVTSGQFLKEYLSGNWKPAAENLKAELSKLEHELFPEKFRFAEPAPSKVTRGVSNFIHE
jgi:ketol-acid reductoisomerase